MSPSVSRPQGFRIYWTHASTNDRFIGELWPDRETAEEVARGVREAGCRDVEIKVAYQ